jgi:hypothetical protein
MTDENLHSQTDSGGVGTVIAAPDAPGGHSRLRLWVNWVLALLTIPAAAAVLMFGLGVVMSTDNCSGTQCQHLGPGWISFNVLTYGAWVVAAVTIIASFFTARRRWGIVVPLLALALLIADIAILATTVAQ